MPFDRIIADLRNRFSFSRAIIVAAGLLGLFGLADVQPAKAQSQVCELALVLAIDASSSVNPREYRLQMEGTAAALTDPDVLDAIAALGGIYLTAFEWNGESNQSRIFDWEFIHTPAQVGAVANAVRNHLRYTRISPTALGSALGYAHRLFPKLPVPCFRQVIDVSGDGASNHGIRNSIWFFSTLGVTNEWHN